MVKVAGKKKSTKRQTLKTKHKIVKRCAESKRKARKAAKSAKHAGIKLRRGKKLTLEIPASYPFKEQELLLQKQRGEQREKDRKKQNELNKQATLRAQKQKRKAAAATPKKPQLSADSVVATSDLLLLVVDARDVMATRMVSLEKHSKPSIIILTKCDLLPREVVNEWLVYLRKSTGCPVITLMKKPDYAAIRKQMSKDPSLLNKNDGVNNTAMDGLSAEGVSMTPAKQAQNAKPYGFSTLVKALAKFEFKTVGIFGYGGVGKHTVEAYLKSPSANLPKRSRVQVGSILEVQNDHLDLTLLQQPQTVAQPFDVLRRVLERCPTKRNFVMKLGLPDFDDVRQLLKNMETEKKLQGPSDAARAILKAFNGLHIHTKVPSESSESELALKMKNFTAEELNALYDQDKKAVDECFDKLDLDLRRNIQMERKFFEIRNPYDTATNKLLIGGPESFFLSTADLMDDDDEDDDDDDDDDEVMEGPEVTE